jgi:hypothetical protein
VNASVAAMANVASFMAGLLFIRAGFDPAANAYEL